LPRRLLPLLLLLLLLLTAFESVGRLFELPGTPFLALLSVHGRGLAQVRGWAGRGFGCIEPLPHEFVAPAGKQVFLQMRVAEESLVRRPLRGRWSQTFVGPSLGELAFADALGPGDNALRFSLSAHFESAAWYLASIWRRWRSCGLRSGPGFAYTSAIAACCRGVINIPPFNVSNGDVLVLGVFFILVGMLHYGSFKSHIWAGNALLLHDLDSTII
jgi:hypothetical protein